MKYLLSSVLVLTGCFSTAHGLWVGPDDKVPTERLLENMKDQLSEMPDDADLLARIGRVYSLRYSLGERDVHVRVEGDAKKLHLYEHGHGYPSIRHGIDDGDVAVRIGDLYEALDYYQRASALAPDSDYIALGLGYTYDELSHAVVVLAKPLGPEFDELRESLRIAWEDKALMAYATALGSRPKLEGGFLTPPVSLEAARYIQEILKQRDRVSRAHKGLLKRADAHASEAARMPRMVTPIIFSLTDDRTIHQLLAPETTVTFDLDGTESGKEWPWVQPDTVLLVWDGDGKRDVPSGRQLIGSVTWWLFWEHGYAVLAALDDDRDGWLRGGELTHLAGWRDANGNGISDAGEVLPLEALGITGLAVSVAGYVDGMPMNPVGVALSDGRHLPSYDWIVSPVE